MTIEEFIEKCQKRPLPSNPMARVRLLARELAEGAAYGIWDAQIKSAEIRSASDVRQYEEEFDTLPDISETLLNIILANRFELVGVKKIFRYIRARWLYGDSMPDFHLLVTNGYIEYNQNQLIITKSAFDLLEETDPATIFISYKRSESSAFALLIEQSLMQAGFSPFLDKQLQAGDDWHTELEKRIQDSDYLIIILGKNTLKSVVTVREITWAIKYNTAIIPIWHNGFAFNSDDWELLNPKISDVINNKHAIRVLEENPLLYDTALRELLNRFGITV